MQYHRRDTEAPSGIFCIENSWRGKRNMHKSIYVLTRTFVFLVIFSFCFIMNAAIFPSSAYTAMTDPSFRFSTIETDHFVIHFHQGLDEASKQVVLISEKIHGRLTSAFQWTPSEKTQVVLLDDTDFANGLATVLPYNAIYINVVPPKPDMSIGEYDNWLELVFIHEYAHILSMDTSTGYASVMRKIFGKPLPGYDPFSFLVFLFSVPPNVMMPDWWLEGMSTWAETEFSSYGRGRSTYYEMLLRMAVFEKRIPRIDQLNGDVPYWPSGEVPYLYGMLMEKEISEKYGKKTPGDLNISHSGRVPFFINAPPKRLTGKNYSGIYSDMIRKLTDNQTERINHLLSEPLTGFKPLPFEGERLTNPRLSPDGKYIAFNRRDPHRHEEIVIADSATYKELAKIRRLPSDHSLSWSPDSRKLYFTQADLRGGFNLYQDIYSYDLAEKTHERITRNLRASDIDVSPDGKRIAFVRTEAGQQSIGIISLDKTDDMAIITDMPNSAFSGLRWSPDGNSIVFSKHAGSWLTSIGIINLTTRTSGILFQDNHNNIYPSWSPDGKYIIFTSDGTGVYNLFAYSLQDRRVFQATHVLGGAFQADVSKNGDRVVFSSYNAGGFSIAEMPYETAGWSAEYSPAIVPAWENLYAEDKGTLPSNDSTPRKYGKNGYSPFSTLLPRFWLPVLYSDHDSAVFGGFTAGQDVLGYHAYYLQAGYGISGQGYFDTSYVYDRWYPSFYLRGYSMPKLYSEFFNSRDDYFERQSGLIAGLRIPVNSLEKRFSIVTGYHFKRLHHLTDINGRKVDGLSVYEGRRDNVFAGIEYHNALKFPYSVSREEGRNITFLYKNYSDNLGSRINQREYSATYDEYIGLGGHHVLFMNLRGATADGDRIAQQAFQLGGIPSVTNEYPLRGYSSGYITGRSVLTGTLEYRFPVYYIFRGWSTKPFFMDRLHVAVFTDAGNVWGSKKGFHWNDFDIGTGTEVRLDMVLGYKLSVTPAIGIAHGLTGGGETQVYLTVYAGF
jgi:Tol biopolymer transport system component